MSITSITSTNGVVLMVVFSSGFFRIRGMDINGH